LSSQHRWDGANVGKSAPSVNPLFQ